MKVLYNLTEGGMSSSEKIKPTASLVSSENPDLRAFAELYDYICTKPGYSYENFMSRTPESWSLSRDFTTTSIIDESNISSTIIITVIATLSVLSLTTYFIIRRKER